MYWIDLVPGLHFIWLRCSSLFSLGSYPDFSPIVHVPPQFTMDPVNFPEQRMRAFVDELHAKGQHFVVIVDPGVAITTDPYPTLERGLADNIFIQAPDGSGPLVGKVCWRARELRIKSTTVYMYRCEVPLGIVHERCCHMLVDVASFAKKKDPQHTKTV